jgi:Ca2+-binding EF-hand superfamily protein
MLFALGAVSTALDALQTLTGTKTSSAQKTGFTQGTTDPFSIESGSASASGAGSSVNSGNRPQILPETMSALIAAQSQSSTGSGASTPMSPQDALKDLFSQIDADGNGKITKTEFEDALGAGGTNLAQADDVFSKLDTDSDGSVSLDEMTKALRGRGHHRHASGASGSGDAGGNGSGGSDALTQALDNSSSTTVTNGDGSSTTTVTYADGFKVSTTTAGKSSASTYALSSYNLIEDLLKQKPESLSKFNPSSALSVSV